MNWKNITSLIFHLDAERVHRWSGRATKLISTFGDRTLERLAGISQLEEVHIPTQVFGMEFRSPVGLAAGFDKNAEWVELLPHLGFGFVEVGTVTPLPQEGNPKPRLFRDVTSRSIFNQMGFNNDGAAVIASRIRRIREKASLPPAFRIGINVGKNKFTPIEDAALDYQKAAAAFEELCDYLVLNISSPNTEGLRSLQKIDAIQRIWDAVMSVTAKWKSKTPILFKLAPEIQGSELIEILHSGDKMGVAGWILTNTLGGEFKFHADEVRTGGWSGAVLTQSSLENLKAALAETQNPIVSVGGIMDESDALLRLQLGAKLIQIYSGWIFKGPRFPGEICRKIKEP